MTDAASSQHTGRTGDILLYEFYVLYGSDITSLTSCHTHQTTMHKVSHAVIESEPYHTDHTVSSLNHHLHLDLDRLHLH